MFEKRNRFWLVGMCLIGCLAFGSLSAGAAKTSKTGKVVTRVSGIGVVDSSASAQDPPQYTYTARVNQKVKKKWKAKYKRKYRECRKGRIVIFFHDENGNDKLDKGETEIGVTKTDKDGKAKFVSGNKTKPGIVPPRGDRIGVFVKPPSQGSARCKAGRGSIPTL
jgi:hypothetical protein